MYPPLRDAPSAIARDDSGAQPRAVNRGYQPGPAFRAIHEKPAAPRHTHPGREPGPGFASMLPPTTATDPDPSALLLASTHAFQLTADGFAGPGAEVVARATAQAQFVLLGEAHHDHDTPLFASALFQTLRRASRVRRHRRRARSHSASRRSSGRECAATRARWASG